MDISVEREASFEVVSRQTNPVVEEGFSNGLNDAKNKKNDDEPIFPSDPFQIGAQAASFSKPVVAKASTGNSPKKVTDFDEFSSQKGFSTPKPGDDPLVDDVWSDSLFEQLPEPGFEEHDGVAASELSTDRVCESVSKVLFPGDHEPVDKILNEDKTNERTDSASGRIQDVGTGVEGRDQNESGAEIIAERSPQQSSPPIDRVAPDPPSSAEKQKSIGSESTIQQFSSPPDTETVHSENSVTLRSPKARSETCSEVDSNAKSHNDRNGVGEDSSRWTRLLAKGKSVKANIVQVRRKLMACHQPETVITFDDDVDVSTIGSDPSKSVNPTAGINESMFSYKSLQHLLSTSQDMLSIPSDASTPVRTGTRNVDRNRGSASENQTTDSISQKQSEDTEETSSSTLKLCIDLYEQSAFQTLMSNLKGNTQVTELHVFRSWEGKAERSRTTEDIGLLFKTIRSLSKLQFLNLANFLMEEIHFVSLSQWRNKNLHTIRIHLCKGALSKRLLDVLAALPALTDLTLEMNESFPIHILLGSPTLESLTIVANGYHIDNLHAMEMVQRLPKNDTLKKLTIEPPLSARTFKLLVSALGKNMGIEYLRFSLLPGNHADANRAMCELARTLMTNASLKSIRNLNHSSIKVKDRTCDEVMKALSKNYIIEDFLVFDEAPWFHERKNRILKENKMEFESVFPQVFNCGDIAGEYPCHSEGNENANSVVGDDSYSVSTSLASISDTMKSQAQRVASGALDYIGETVGLSKRS